MDAATAALKAALEGVELPADKGRLLVAAVQHRVDPQHLEWLQVLPDRTYTSIDDVLEELSHAGFDAS
jgi:hypothetical protein